jgi:hypothetical protein
MHSIGRLRILSHHWQVFWTWKNSLGLNELEQTQEVIEAKQKLDELLSQTITFGFSKLNLPDRDKKALSKFLPVEKDEMTLKEWLGFFSNVYDNVRTNKVAHREMRSYLHKYLNADSLAAERAVDINRKLKCSPIDKTFEEYVYGSLNHDGKKEISDQEFMVQAYQCLDLLGISNDQNKKLKGVDNMNNDALHAFYGSYCDCVVARDQGFLRKTKLLYDLLYVETTVLTLEELNERVT